MFDIDDKRYRALEPCMRSLQMNTPDGWVKRTSPLQIRLVCPIYGLVSLAFFEAPEVLSMELCEKLPPELYAEALFYQGEKEQYMRVLRSSSRALRYIIRINDRYGDYTPETAEAVSIARAIQVEKVIQKTMRKIRDANG